MAARRRNMSRSATSRHRAAAREEIEFPARMLRRVKDAVAQCHADGVESALCEVLMTCD